MTEINNQPTTLILASSTQRKDIVYGEIYDSNKVYPIEPEEKPNLCQNAMIHCFFCCCCCPCYLPYLCYLCFNGKDDESPLVVLPKSKSNKNNIIVNNNAPNNIINIHSNMNSVVNNQTSSSPSTNLQLFSNFNIPQNREFLSDLQNEEKEKIKRNSMIVPNSHILSLNINNINIQSDNESNKPLSPDRRKSVSTQLFFFLLI